MATRGSNNRLRSVRRRLGRWWHCRCGSATRARSPARDIGRLAAFYRQFGWPEAPTDVTPTTSCFNAQTAFVSGLFSETLLERRYRRAADSFRGFTLTIHCENEEVVDRAHDEVGRFDDVFEHDAEPTRSGWGQPLRLPRS